MISTAGLALLVVVTGGCGGGSDEGARISTEAAGRRASSGAAASDGNEVGVTGSGVVRVDWQDPEPPEAQAVAESVLRERWNADKTTRLRMRITTLVNRTTGIEGVAGALIPEQRSLESRLEDLGAEVTAAEVRIRLSGAIVFDFDSAAIRPDAEGELAEVAEVLLAYGERPVRVEGHTDAIASEAYNLELSERRAASVSAWLEARGVAAKRLHVVGWGEGRPVADNGTAEGRQLNRRVEVIVDRGR